MAINLTTKFSEKVQERFTKKSLTGSVASNEYTFDGIKNLVVYSVDTAPLNQYNRSGMNRYGTPAELQDTTQQLTMTQDKAFTYTIDKGNQKEQMNIKGANRSLQREIDEVIIPTMDKYRFERWSHDAGSHVSDNGASINKNSITAAVMDCTELLDEAFAPDSGRTMFIPNKYYKLLKQNPDFIENDKLGEAALVRGQVGMIDNMTVVKVPNTYLPAGVNFLITHKSAILAPAKLQDYKIHRDPPGLNGDLVEGRIMHDAFVLETKAKAVCVHLNSAYVINAPAITNDTTNSAVKMTSTTAGVDVWYTTDGSDPAFSTSAHKVGANTANVTYAVLNNSETGTAGKQTIRAVAVPNSNAALFKSDIAELAYA